VLEVVVLDDEPELEVDADVLDEEDDEPELLALEVGVDVVLLLLVVVVVEVVVVVDDEAGGAQDSLSDTTTPWIGRFMAEIGVPGATFTLNV
jgi:hypothetical protein